MNSLPWSYLSILENIRKTVHYYQQVEDAQQPGSRGRRHRVTPAFHTALTAEYVEVAESTSKKKNALV